jgi:hypothetical protein
MRNALGLNQYTRLQVWQLVEKDPRPRLRSDPVDLGVEDDNHLATDSSMSTDGCATLLESANTSTLPGRPDANFSRHIKAVEDVLNVFKCENRKVKSHVEPCCSAT